MSWVYGHSLPARLGVVLMHVHTPSSAEQAVPQPFPQAWAGLSPAQSSHRLLQALQWIE